MKKKLGFALTGSFCTLDKAFDAIKQLSTNYEIFPILSETVANTDTRFFKKEEVFQRLEQLCGKKPWTSIPQVEPIGPKDLFDLLVICPCTGNTLSKIAYGITDTSVTMAAKSHRRQGKPVLLALSTNDALSGSAASLGKVLDKKHYYFVPLRQDDPKGKPFSLQCDFSLLPDAIEAALEEKQLQPLFLSHT